MPNKLILILVVFIVTGASVAKPQAKALAEHSLMEANENPAAREKRYADETYDFTIGNLSYRVTGQGMLSVQTLKSGRTSANMRMDFPEDSCISGVKYLPLDGDLIVVYDVLLLKRPVRFADKVLEEDVLQRRVVRLRAKTLKTRWVAITAKSDPPGPVTIAAGSMFVSGVGEIGEIDLATGFYLWRHEDISHGRSSKYAFFKAPRVEGEFVFFQEDPAILRDPDTIQVKRRSGEIITMSFKPSR
jgi:hypothetical protein